MGNCSPGISFTLDQHSNAIFDTIRRNDFLGLEKLVNEKKLTKSMINEDGYTPLHLATELGFEECVKVLLENGADVNAPDRMEIPAIGGPYQLRPIHLAVSKGYFNIVRILLNNKAKINIKTAMGWTPLHDVMVNDKLEYSHISCIKLLIDNGADLNLKDTDGQMPIDAAIFYGHFEAAKLLLNCGTRFNKMSNNVDPGLLKPRGDRGQRVYSCAAMCVLAGCEKIIDNYRTLRTSFEDPDSDTPFVVEQMDKLIKLHYGMKSLKQLCRLTIRKSKYGKNLSPLVQTLHIPNELKDYLLLEQL
jgi:ankyrin repeat protein